MMNLASLQRMAAQSAFLLLFPGFFFYQTGIGIGVLPSFLGGYFTPVALALMPFLAGIYLLEVQKSRQFLTRIDFVFWGFILYFFFIVAFNYADRKSADVVKNHLLAMIHYVVVFSIFRLADFNAKRFRQLALISLIGMTLIIFYMSVDGLFYLKQLGESADSDSVATYQGFARSYFVTFLVVVPFMKARTSRMLLYAICVPALFLNGARSELAAVIAMVAIFEVFHSRSRLKAVLLIFAGAALALAFWGALSELIPATRSRELLDLSSSHSWETRMFLLSYALQTIAANPLLGDYGSYVALYGHAGSYAHNIFSAWVDLGLLGFVYVLAMCALPLYFLFSEIVSRKRSAEITRSARHEELLLAFSLMFVTMLMILTAKSFTYMLIGAALGRYAYYRSMNVYAQSRTPHLRSSAQRHAHLYQAMPKPGVARL